MRFRAPQYLPHDGWQPPWRAALPAWAKRFSTRRGLIGCVDVYDDELDAFLADPGALWRAAPVECLAFPLPGEAFARLAAAPPGSALAWSFQLARAEVLAERRQLAETDPLLSA